MRCQEAIPPGTRTRLRSVSARRTASGYRACMPREGTGPDFIEALARGLEVIAAFAPNRPPMTLADVAARDRAGPPDRPPDPAHPAGAGLRPGRRPRLRAHPAGARAGRGLRALDGHLGGGPAAPGTALRPDRGVLLDRPARRPGHRLRGPGRGAEDRRAGRADRHPVPGAADLAGQGAAGRAGPGRGGRGAGRADPLRAGPALAAGPRRTGRRAARGAGPRLGADRPAAGAGHPVGRRRRCATGRAG